MTREVAGAVQALEEAEEPLRRSHVEARAVVAHHEGGLLTVRLGPHRHLGLRAAAGVFPGIAQQVLEHQAQQRGVAPGGHAGFDVELGGAVRRAAAQVVDHVAGQLRQVDTLARQRLLRQPRQRQQRVDHQVHARGGAQHTVEVVVADAVEVASVVFFHDAREALDDADRRAQVV